MSHNSTAKAVRLRKEERPELYCIHRQCLHRAPCPKHARQTDHCAEPTSRFTKQCDEGCMNDMRFGESPDY